MSNQNALLFAQFNALNAEMKQVLDRLQSEIENYQASCIAISECQTELERLSTEFQAIANS